MSDQADCDDMHALSASAGAHMRAGEWAAARQEFQEMADRGRNTRAMIERCDWRMARLAQYETHFGSAEHKERVRDHFQRLLGEKILNVFTRTAPVGYVSVGAFMHRLRFADRPALRIYEKVFANSDAERIAQEQVLFTHHSARELRAPEYFATSQTGEFISVFYQYVNGTEPSPSEWQAMLRETIQYFWSIPPAAGLQNYRQTRANLALKLLPRLDTLIEERTPEIENAIRVIAANQEVIAAAVAQAPKFVFHLDLTAPNVLIDESRTQFIIDWEKWSIEPVGFGWVPRLPKDSEFPVPDIASLIEKRQDCAWYDRDRILMMSSLWGLSRGFTKRDQQRMSSWVLRLAEAVEPVTKSNSPDKRDRNRGHSPPSRLASLRLAFRALFNWGRK